MAFAKTVPMGDGLDETVQLGPIQNEMQFNKVSRFVEEAKKAGGRILCGGAPTGGKGYFYPVTFVADVKEGTPLVDEEQFGPALPIIRYTDVEDALKRANADPLGLGGSVWGADTTKAKQLAQRLECGITWVNRHGGIQPNTPFGGVKQSGIGVEFNVDGLKEYTVQQTVWV